jgi:hypothetical protein
MAGAENVPGWAERLLMPTLESRVRADVNEEAGHLEKTISATSDAVNMRADSVKKRMNDRFHGADARIESLEKRILMIRDTADLKAGRAAVEERTSG